MKIGYVTFENPQDGVLVAEFVGDEFTVATYNRTLIKELTHAAMTNDDVYLTSRELIVKQAKESAYAGETNGFAQGYRQGHDEGRAEAAEIYYTDGYNAGHEEGQEVAKQTKLDIVANAGILGYEEAKQRMVTNIQELVSARLINAPTSRYLLTDFSNQQLSLIEGFIKSFHSPSVTG